MGTGTGGYFWMRRQAARPAKPGSMRSRTTRSGRARSTRATPDGPSAATSTSNPSLRSRAATAAAMGCSSSMTTTLATPGGYGTGRGERAGAMRRFLGDRRLGGAAGDGVEQGPDLVVGGGGEVDVGLADGQEPLGHPGAEDVVGFGPERPAGVGGPHRHGGHHRRGFLGLERVEGGPHAGSGGEAVVDHDHRGAGDAGRRPVMAIGPLPAGRPGRLAPGP